MSKTILITGCSSGIGKALAEEFHKRGHRVHASGRRLDSLQALADLGIRTLVLDVTDEASIQAAIEQIEGGIDILINNAGFSTITPAIEAGTDTLRRQFETNTIAPMAVAAAALPKLIERRGTIVNIGSIVGLVTVPFRGVYGASKSALHTLSDALRLELAPFGVRVVTVRPGGIRSSIADKATEVRLQGSRYAKIADIIARDRHVSQLNAMPAEIFAARVADAVLRPNPRATLTLGTNSFLLPNLKRFLPPWLSDKMLKRRFGLDQL